MSELKTYNSERIYWAVEQAEQEAGDIEDLHLDDNLFYIKEDADKEIDFWKKESHCERWFSLNKQYEGWLGKVMRCERAERELRHQKYERCLAVARLCRRNRLHSSVCGPVEKIDFWEKWRKRWLELAEKFKEAK